jgi:UDP-2-acetamido-3-amino-2,3-dideoxy-glucuronate N-acetyltransferase
MMLLNPSTTRIERCSVDPTVTFVGWTNAYDSVFESGVFVGPFCEIGGTHVGKNSRIGSHSYLCPGVNIGMETFIGHGVQTTNDLFDDVPEYESLEELRDQWKKQSTIIGNRVRIGSGAVILPVTIGDGAIIGAGAVILRDVAPGDIVVGNPARKVGNVDPTKF